MPLIDFERGQRKDEVAKGPPADVRGPGGSAGHRQGAGEGDGGADRAAVQPADGRPYAWLVRTTALVNQYSCYAVVADFGPFFLKFCSYFRYNAKLCLNGHEHLKRQLAKEGIAFEALDIGLSTCPAARTFRAVPRSSKDRSVTSISTLPATASSRASSSVST